MTKKDIIVAFDEYQLAKRNELASVGGILAGWGKDARLDGFVVYYEITEIVDPQTYRVKSISKVQDWDKLGNLSFGKPILHYTYHPTEYGKHENYCMTHSEIPRTILIED